MATSLQFDARGEDRPEAVGRFDVFRVLSDRARAAQRKALLRILSRRDGPHRFPELRLPSRERYFAALAADPVRVTRPLDLAAVEETLYGAGQPPLGERETWLCAVATSNENEHFAVEGEIARYRRRGFADVDPVELYQILEESYHSRILAEACVTCGLDLRMRTPGWAMRVAIYAMQTMHPRLRHIGILCGEFVGCVVFEALRDATACFADEPAVRERLWTLCNEILTDETLHVLYCRTRLSPWAIRMAQRVALPLVIAAVAREVPQLVELGITPAALRQRALTGLAIPPDLGWPEFASASP